MTTITTTWISGVAFDSNVQNHHIIMDSTPEHGGIGSGPNPKPLLLASLGGCTGMDVVSILGKMKVSFDGFKIIAEAETQDDHPKVYTKIHLIYEFLGKELPLEKLKKACDLSQERYCSVSAMLKKSCPLTYEISTINR